MKTKNKIVNSKLEIFVAEFTSKYKTRQDLMNLQYELGIDEAGRGPVMGPMVYSALWWPKIYKEKFAELGFDDSKVLKEQEREVLFELIRKYSGTLFFFEVEVISADTLSRKQQRFDSINLNTISHNAAIKLLRSALSQGFKITDVYVDTVGDPDKYKAYIRSRIPQYTGITHNIVVQAKADRDHKVVSASSVCAKVTRDRIIRDWKFVENLGVDVGDGGDGLGSGYPSDPKTKEWLAKNKHRVFGFPNLIRFSWQTCANILDNYCVLKMKQEKDEERHKGLTGLLKKQIDLFQMLA